MDRLTKELQAFLVKMHYEPEAISHQMEHYMEHLFHLLPPDEEEAVLHYFGVLGHEQQSLNELACVYNLSPEDMMQQIDSHLRRLAVTPEWQMMKSKSSEDNHNHEN